jgi:hypothetical protein
LIECNGFANIVIKPEERRDRRHDGCPWLSGGEGQGAERCGTGSSELMRCESP